MEPTTDSSDKSVHYCKKKSNSYSSQAEAMSFFEEGNLSMNNGDYGTAIKNYKRCLENADENNVKMMVYFGLGNAYTLSDNWEEGLNSFNLCLKFSSEVESEHFEHQVYLGLGSVHSTIKRLEDAIKKGEMECLCNIALGGLNKLLKNYEQSLDHYRKGFSLIESQQQQHEQHHRPQRQRKVGGINVNKDFVNLNMKNLSIVTSAGIVNGVLAVFWELAELFDKLEQWGDATFIYEMYLEMVTKDEDIEKQINVMERLVQIYDEEERYYLRNSMEAKLQEIIKKKNEKEWEYIGESVKHKELFLKLIKYRRNPNVEVKHVDNVRVIISEEFCIGRGSDGTRVYLGLKKDGYGKAVKRIRRDNCITIAQKEKEILNEFNAKESKYVVKYYYLEEDTETDYVYLIIDLCEESLESFVESSTLQDLQKSLPEILKQMLKGLADLHCNPCPILHRDLKPSNVLRDAHGKFLIADFGISRKLKGDLKTYYTSSKRGTQDWIAPESYCKDEDSVDKARYKKESDVMNAGMLAYYVATKGKHPFGTEDCRLQNLLHGNHVGLGEIKDAVFLDLLLWMLQLKPEDRPSANDALKHPYLQSDEEKFDMLCNVGNQPEIKLSKGQNSHVRKHLDCHSKWMELIDDEVLDDFTTFEKNGKKKTLTYKPTWARCLRFLRNVKEHWYDKTRTHLLRYVKEGNYVDYFLQLFPELPLLVHKIIRSTDWKTRPDLKKHFTYTVDHVKIEEVSGKKSKDVMDNLDLDGK